MLNPFDLAQGRHEFSMTVEKRAGIRKSSPGGEDLGEGGIG